MKTIRQILAAYRSNDNNYTIEEAEKELLDLFSVSERFYTENDLIAAAKYGYEYRDTTSFPELSFEDNCENNTKQWIAGVLNAR